MTQHTAQPSVLFVDDEPNILDTFRRNLRKVFSLETAQGPEQGLAVIREKGPFAVVVSDLKMPGMNGIDFLEHVRQIHPDTVRIVLTGHGDFNAAMDAVNKGAVFRFLTKPCSPELLVSTVREGFKQYRLITAEKELLRGTLSGSVKVLVDVLSLVSPEAFGRSERVRDIVSQVGKKMDAGNLWQMDVAAMLCQIGCLSLPEELMDKVINGEELTPEDQQIFGMHPEIGSSLLRNIPRMDGVADIIAHQLDTFSENVPIGSRILRVALDFDKLEHQGKTVHEAITQLVEKSTQGSVYDPQVVDALRSVLFEREGGEVRALRLDHIDPGMVMARDLVNKDGTVLLRKGQAVTASGLKRLKALSDLLQVSGPIEVLVPAGYGL